MIQHGGPHWHVCPSNPLIKEEYLNVYPQDDSQDDSQILIKNAVPITIFPQAFYSQNDENFLFYWFKYFKGIKAIVGYNLYIDPREVSSEDIRDLRAIFKRYKFQDIHQLYIFMNKNNKDLFESFGPLEDDEEVILSKDLYEQFRNCSVPEEVLRQMKEDEKII